MITAEKFRIYQKAFVEVLAVLDRLEKKEYDKIPKDYLDNMVYFQDKDYVFEQDTSLDLDDWKLMPETEAILYTIVRDYLCDPEEREYYEAKEAKEWGQIYRKNKTD